jgi:hypothetical protein
MNNLVWIEKIFAAKAAQNGGIVRRKVSNVEKYASEWELKSAVKARGFHLVRCGDQYVILCNRGTIKVVQ